MKRDRAFAALCVLGAASCGKGSSGSQRVSDAGASGGRDGAVVVDAGPPEDPRVVDLWARGEGGDADDLLRLCREVGSDGLVESYGYPSRRLTTVRALAFADDFDALPFLVTVATSADDALATAAFDTVAALAAEPRRATDPEDALALQDGLSRLLPYAKDVTKPRPRRVLAIRALRLFADRGSVAPGEVPTDLDAH